MYIIRQVLEEDLVHLLHSFRSYDELASPFALSWAFDSLLLFLLSAIERGIICAQVKVIPRTNFRAECVIISLKSLKYQQSIFSLRFSARYFQQDRYVALNSLSNYCIFAFPRFRFLKKPRELLANG